MAKRPHSFRFTARANPRRYLLSGIPPTMWEKVRAQAKREHISVRELILGLLEGWLLQRGPDWGKHAIEAAQVNRPAYEAMQQRHSARLRTGGDEPPPEPSI